MKIGNFTFMVTLKSSFTLLHRVSSYTTLSKYMQIYNLILWPYEDYERNDMGDCISRGPLFLYSRRNHNVMSCILDFG